jgi:hypothetical protein
MALNPQNLVPNSERTPDERRRNAQKAGIASGEKRRHQRDLREAVKALQSVVVPVKGGGDGLTYAEAIARAVGVKAAQGDLKAAALLWEWLYGKQTKVDVTSSDGSMSPGNQINLGDRTTEELMQMFKALGSGNGDGQGSSS